MTSFCYPFYAKKILNGGFAIFKTFLQNEITIEVKSLQTNSIKRLGHRFIGKAQVDASDSRNVTFKDGTTLKTTCLLAGEFDLLAVNLFAFEERWRFIFAKNADLPRSPYKKYTDAQRTELLASSVTATWPVELPFTDEPFALLDEIIAEKASGKAPTVSVSDQRLADGTIKETKVIKDHKKGDRQTKIKEI